MSAEKEISELRMRLADDLQSVYLAEALEAIHPAIIQLALEQFAKVAIQRKADRRINLNRVMESNIRIFFLFPILFSTSEISFSGINILLFSTPLLKLVAIEAV